MALLLGGIGAAGGLLQRRMGLPDATVLVLQGMIFIAILASETMYGRMASGSSPRGLQSERVSKLSLVAMLAGSLRVSTPFLFVSLGECLTERAGRINLGNEGVLVLGAMVAYATSYLTGNPWLGVAGGRGGRGRRCWGACMGWSAALAKVNDVAMGIAILLAGDGSRVLFWEALRAAECAGPAGHSVRLLVGACRNSAKRAC